MVRGVRAIVAGSVFLSATLVVACAPAPVPQSSTTSTTPTGSGSVLGPIRQVMATGQTSNPDFPIRAECAPGEVVLSGGFSGTMITPNVGNVVKVLDRPFTAPDGVQGWEVAPPYVQNGAATLTAYAICAGTAAAE